MNKTITYYLGCICPCFFFLIEFLANNLSEVSSDEELDNVSGESSEQDPFHNSKTSVATYKLSDDSNDNDEKQDFEDVCEIFIGDCKNQRIKQYICDNKKSEDLTDAAGLTMEYKRKRLSGLANHKLHEEKEAKQKAVLEKISMYFFKKDDEQHEKGREENQQQYNNNQRWASTRHR
ncbi:hypothetical protein FQA39_LY02424 [Lamprigera yunnana]|nr:hypothetical protein FQA39_LY02424 [Lamprigera yunnana]